MRRIIEHRENRSYQALQQFTFGPGAREDPDSQQRAQQEASQILGGLRR
jgi:hypothetical protein